MAFNLQAALRLDGSQFSNALRRITRETQRANRTTERWRDNQGRLRDSMGRFASNTNNASNATQRFGSSLRNATGGIAGMRSGLGGLATGLLGVASAYAAINGASKIFEKTVGAAATMEQSQTIIGAMIGEQKAAIKYMKMMDNLAIKSPLLDSQGMYANSLGVVALTKNLKEPLKAQEKTWKLVERLTALNPNQAMGGGVEGAVFALRNLASADIISLQDRFNLDKRVLNNLKHLTFEEQLKGLEKYLDKIGVGEELINKMGNTTLGLWTQVKEQTQRILRDMGQPSLEVVSNFLTQILDKLGSGELDGFANVGARWIKSILSGLTSGISSLYNWFTTISSSPEFQAQTTLFGQVKWVIEDVYQRFVNWLDSGGRDKIAKTASNLIQILTASIEASMHFITPIAVKVGGALADGVISGFSSSFSNSWIAQLIQDPVGFALKKATGGKLNLLDHGKGVREKIAMKGASGPLPYNSMTNNIRKYGPSHASGLTRVPYNGYQATLHKNERVLTPEEAKAYNNGGGKAVNITVNYQGTGNTEEDAKKLIDVMARMLEREGAFA